MSHEINLDSKTSPMMAQWHACKKKAKDATLFFRVGDFYEAFYEDAIFLSKELDLTLTKRHEIPMAGIPFHASESYIDKLIAKGYKVAVAEQTEDPKATKGLVNRDIVRFVTPGTLTSSSLLNDKTNNFFMAIFGHHKSIGVAYIDLSTSEFFVLDFSNVSDLASEIYRLHPAEILVNKKFMEKNADLITGLKQAHNFLINEHDEWRFETQITHHFLLNHFKVTTLEGFGLHHDLTAATSAAGALLQYLQEELCLSITHIQDIRTYSTSSYMHLDATSQKNLELTESQHDGSKKHTLLEVLDHTRTPMGARLLRNWVKQPLLCPVSIIQRQDAVELFFHHKDPLENLRSLLDFVRDLERLTMRIVSGHASARDLLALCSSLEPIPEIKSLVCLFEKSDLLKKIAEEITPLPEVTSLIKRAIHEEPPVKLSDGNVIKQGFNADLDELRLFNKDSKNWIANYQTTLRETTGIKTLKVGYNRMFGYYIEVSRGQADRMPDTFERKQTLVNAERFISPELKNYEIQILSAEEKIHALELELFQLVRGEISKYSSPIIRISQSLAILDAIQSLGYVARKQHYIRPTVDENYDLSIQDGRHPVIESTFFKEKFICNDTTFNLNERLYLITGPNMAGKSTFLRQVALITIMSQMGSFVPASFAHIGIVDRVFTRIGASDDLSRGQSTFMVEMIETANILNNATDRSLILLDEIGRGTSTYDGISIAWAVAEHLLTSDGQRGKTLFATHYGELTELEKKVPGAVNYKVAVQENEGNILFLRKIERGEADKSYGIQVGALAGLPSTAISRAKEILEHLEENANRKVVFEPAPAKIAPKRKKGSRINPLQLTFFN